MRGPRVRSPPPTARGARAAAQVEKERDAARPGERDSRDALRRSRDEIGAFEERQREMQSQISELSRVQTPDTSTASGAAKAEAMRLEKQLRGAQEALAESAKEVVRQKEQVCGCMLLHQLIACS